MKRETIHISKDEYKARRTLEEAQRRGIVSMVSSDQRNGSQFKVNTPWMSGTARGNPSVMPDIVKGKNKAKIGEWYPRGVPQEQVYKYRKGACENCGAITHQRKDCLDRPRRVGAKFSGTDFKGDEDIKELEFDFEAKIDRWNGYNPDSYKEVIEEYELMNNKIEERNKEKGFDPNDEFKEKLYNRQYLDTEFDPKTKTSLGLRQKQDKAKYLENLDDDAPSYDGKSRVMNGNPNPNKDIEDQEFKGDNYYRFSGDTVDFLHQDKFAWDHVRKYNSELNSVAMPTLTEMLHKKSQAMNQMQRGKLFDEMSKRYGGDQHFAPHMEELLTSKDQYVEYDEKGQVINKGVSQKQGRSKYPEDLYPQDHTSVWGSWWNKELGWGFICCHGTDRNAICMGDKGKKMAVVREYRVLKKREADMKFTEQNDSINKLQVETSKRLEEIEKVIDEQKIHINLESHRAYEKQLAEQNQKKFEDEKNQKFQISIKESISTSNNEQPQTIDKSGGNRDRSRSQEKNVNHNNKKREL